MVTASQDLSVARLPLNKKSRVIKCKPRGLLGDVNVGRRACKHYRKHELSDSEKSFRISGFPVLLTKEMRLS